MKLFKICSFLLLLPGCSCGMNKISHNAQNHIVLLNGTSSAGKSSIVKELLPLLRGTTEVVSFDQAVGEVYDAVRKKISDERGGITITDADIDSYFDAMDPQARTHACEEMEAQVFLTLCTKVRENFNAGKNVIIDILIEEKHDANLILKPLHDLPVCMILAYCPLKSLLQHLLDRNALSDETEHRGLTAPFEQFFHMYKKHDTASAFKVDTLNKTQAEWIFAEMTRITKEQEKQPDALAQSLADISKLSTEVYEKFGLDKCDEVSITSELVYDLTVNTGSSTATECAQAVFQWLESGVKPTAIQKNYEQSLSE